MRPRTGIAAFVTVVGVAGALAAAGGTRGTGEHRRPPGRPGSPADPWRPARQHQQLHQRPEHRGRPDRAAAGVRLGRRGRHRQRQLPVRVQQRHRGRQLRRHVPALPGRDHPVRPACRASSRCRAATWSPASPRSPRWRSTCPPTASTSRSWTTWRRRTRSTSPTPTRLASSTRPTRSPAPTTGPWPRCRPDGQLNFTETNAYSGNNGRAAILAKVSGKYVHLHRGQRRATAPTRSRTASSSAPARRSSRPSSLPESAQQPGAPTPVGSFNVTSSATRRTRSARTTTSAA